MGFATPFCPLLSRYLCLGGIPGSCHFAFLAPLALWLPLWQLCALLPRELPGLLPHVFGPSGSPLPLGAAAPPLREEWKFRGEEFVLGQGGRNPFPDPPAAAQGSQGVDILRCGSCFRQHDRPAHMTVLAVGVTVELTSLHSQKYQVMYLNSNEGAQRALFRAGRMSMLLPAPPYYGSIVGLPFADFAVDVVVANATEWDRSGRRTQAVAEAIRVLAPGGTLALLPATAVLPSAKPPLAAALQQLPGGGNLFRRAAGLVHSLPVCSGCQLGPAFSSDPTAGFWGNCQPYIAPSYVPLSDPKLEAKILEAPSIDAGRMKWWPLSNVLKQYNRSWSQKTYSGSSEWFHYNYVGESRKDGSRGPVTKREWHFSDWIRSGKVTSLLDAGGGTCSLAYVLRKEGLMSRLKPYVAFGAYDCSMLRICAQRGTIEFQWDWLKPLPFCKTCQFDMVFQAEGVHHINGRNWERTWENFMANVKCGGWLFVTDHPCVAREYFEIGGKKLCWRHSVKDWARRKGHPVSDDVLVQKRC